MKKFYLSMGMMVFLVACSTKATDSLVTTEKNEPIINQTAPETLEESEVVSEIEESTVKPETSVVKPETPVAKPETSVVEPETSVVEDNKMFNQAFEKLSITVGERDLGVVVHNLDETKLTNLNLVEYVESPIEETFLFVPTYVGSNIKIYEMSFGDAGLVAGDVLFELSNSKQNEALYLKCVVPEGIPHMKVVMSYEGQVSEYIIRYDGVGNRAQVAC